ncbi:MAG: zf-HC2 domain-containing protein [Acidimicrobiia bacterium]
MDCSDIRSSVSAALDGEDSGMSDSMVRGHLAECTACRAYSADVSDLHRMVRVQPATPEIDRTHAILAALPRREPAPTSADHMRSLRFATFVIASVQLVAAVPLVLGLTSAMAGMENDARHIGVFSAALAVGLFAVAWQPERARALLPILGVLVVGLAWSCLDDLMAGHAMPGTAIAHGADVAGFAVVWLIARGHRDPASDTGRRRAVLR